MRCSLKASQLCMWSVRGAEDEEPSASSCYIGPTGTRAVKPTAEWGSMTIGTSRGNADSQASGNQILRLRNAWGSCQAYRAILMAERPAVLTLCRNVSHDVEGTLSRALGSVAQDPPPLWGDAGSLLVCGGMQLKAQVCGEAFVQPHMLRMRTCNPPHDGSSRTHSASPAAQAMTA